MNDYQFDFIVAMLKQEMKKNATSMLQRDEIDRRIDIASHKTKFAAAFFKGDLQKAFMELGIAEYKQRNY
ncbi:MAG: hypothetical protein E7077_13745 [Bacteroidales bacterium]|jgi:hypothetical protein|nr:hypothetical protein [Bacteroidales bacterium]